MRRRTSHESSLDLLLDTICNMFGMVIFIAVLAAVLARAGGTQRIAEAAAMGDDAAELDSIRLAIEELEANDDEIFREKWEMAAEELRQARDYADRLDISISTLEQQLADAESTISLEQMRMDIQTLKDELNEFLRDIALHSKLQNQINYTQSPDAVSSDFVGTREAGIVDSHATIVNGRHCVLYLWYDNEFGYCCQVGRMVYKMTGVRYQNYPVDE